MRRGRRVWHGRLARALTLASLAVAAAGVDPAWAVQGVDVRNVAPASRLLGEDAAVQSAGDFNGDGRPDLIAGLTWEEAEARRCEPLDEPIRRDDARNFQDVAHLVLGASGRSSFDVHPLSPGVLRLACPSELEDRGPPGSGVSYGITIGGTVAAAGDVDRDGLADVAVGTLAASPRGRPGAGSVYLVYGSREATDVDLRSLGPRGIRIDGPERASELGDTIAAVGDVNGDGGPDLALTYRVGVASRNGRRLPRPGVRVAIVFGGQPPGTRVDLAAPGSKALIVTGLERPTRYDTSQVPEFNLPDVSVGPAGDLNRDGRADVAVGLTKFAVAGVVRVLAGRAGGGIVDIRREPSLLRVVGEDGDRLGSSLASGGDLDGDGRPELAIASSDPPRTSSFPTATGSVTIVPGRPGSIDLSRRPSGVRRISGPREAGGHFGSSLAAAGDVTGDGLPDLVVGAQDASPGCRHGAGAAWVLPGARDTGARTITDIPGAWRVDGAHPQAGLGRQVGVGDLDTDGQPDLLLPARPFHNAAVADLFAVPIAQPRTTLASLQELCVTPRLEGRSLSEIRRSGRVRVNVASSLGGGERHSVLLSVRVVRAPAVLPRGDGLHQLVRRFHIGPAARQVLRYRGPGSVERAIRLSPRLLTEARGPGAYVVLEAEQRLSRDPLGLAFGIEVVPLGTAPPLPGLALRACFATRRGLSRPNDRRGCGTVARPP